MTARPKFPYVRSEALRRAVASLPCVSCGQYGATQAAHSNLAEHGKGRSIKATDAAIMALCPTCHADLDEGRQLTHEAKRGAHYVYITRTYIALVTQGLLTVAPGGST